MKKLNAKQLRKSKPQEKDLAIVKRNPIYLVLDRIIDTYNTGSLFRLGDAIACEKMYLCGDMEYPPSSRIHKAAVGTEVWVPWEKRATTLDTIRYLKEKNTQVIAIEQHPKSTNYKLLTTKINFPVALIVGNETHGIEKDVLNESNVIVELPMYGINKSFNTWGSAAIIAYKVLENI